MGLGLEGEGRKRKSEKNMAVQESSREDTDCLSGRATKSKRKRAMERLVVIKGT